jgi:fermentation-respiration switch protein FrsA (DUF1100 family)
MADPALIMNPIARTLVVLSASFASLGCQSSTSPQIESRPVAANVVQDDPPPAPIADTLPSSRPAKSRSIDELLLFFPSKFPHGRWQPPGLKFEDAWFTAEDGTKLHGWYCPCDRPRAVMLYAHGNAGNLSHRAELIKFWQTELGVSSLIFDYRGYGRSEGTPTVDGVLQDARAAQQFLAKRAGVAEEQIVLAGQSLGGAIVVDLAARTGARALVLESTFSSLKDVATHHYPRLAWLVSNGKLDSAARIAKYKGPLLQCHGDADRTIPFALGQKLHAAANEPKQFVRMPLADHNDPLTAEYWRKLERFIAGLGR